MKIYFLRSSPITELDAERFGYKILKRKFEVKFLDVTKIFNKNHIHYVNLKNFENIDNIQFSNLDELKSYILSNPPNLIIDYLKFGFKENKIRIFLKKNKIKLIRNIYHGPKPNLISPLDNKSFLKKFLFRTSNYLKKIIVDLFFVKFDYYLIPGLSVFKNYNINEESDKAIKTVSLDYDKSIQLNKINIKVSKNYSVFIDQDFPNHIDHKIKKRQPQISENEYFPLLSNFFNKYETIYDTKVIIAAHPKSSTKFENFFKQEILHGYTSELIRDSNEVFAHYSTAISFAVIFKKPIIFLTSNNLKKSRVGKGIVDYSNLLNSPLVNMDEFICNPKEIEKKINEKKYNSFYSQFIKCSEINNKSSWEIFSDFLESSIK